MASAAQVTFDTLSLALLGVIVLLVSVLVAITRWH
jgi:hypothetical protein